MLGFLGFYVASSRRASQWTRALAIFHALPEASLDEVCYGAAAWLDASSGCAPQPSSLSGQSRDYSPPGYTKPL